MKRFQVRLGKVIVSLLLVNRSLSVLLNRILYKHFYIHRASFKKIYFGCAKICYFRNSLRPFLQLGDRTALIGSVRSIITSASKLSLDVFLCPFNLVTEPV